MTLEGNKLTSDKGKVLKMINDNGDTLPDGTIIPPYTTTIVYLGAQITTLEQAQELYEEIDA